MQNAMSPHPRIAHHVAVRLADVDSLQFAYPGVRQLGIHGVTWTHARPWKHGDQTVEQLALECSMESF